METFSYGYKATTATIKNVLKLQTVGDSACKISIRWATGQKKKKQITKEEIIFCCHLITQSIHPLEGMHTVVLVEKLAFLGPIGAREAGSNTSRITYDLN